MDDAWINPDGGWTVEDGWLINTTTCGFQTCAPNLYAGGADQSSYLVSFDYIVSEATSANGASISFYVALTNPIEPEEGITSGYIIGGGYSATGLPEDAQGAMGIINDSTGPGTGRVVDERGSQFWNEPNTLYHVVLGRSGPSLVYKKWADGEPEPIWQLTFDDDTYLGGYWMPAIWHGMIAIDNFVVTGMGVVSNKDMTWSGVKALYR